MSLSLYDVSVPVFTRSLRNLSAILEKGRTWADENGLAHAELLGARLYADMKPLTYQVQRASDAARLTAVRIALVEPLEISDEESSFDELQSRIAATLGFLDAVPRSAMDGREEAEVILKMPGRELTFTGRDYVLGFAVPNFFFHVTTAYGLLRHNGVPIGKTDFIGGR
ncbi:MAG: DUF1993 domain-containing protein [Oricola sp.]